MYSTPKYDNSITLIGYEINYDGSPKYFGQKSDGIIVEPNIFSRSIYIDNKKLVSAKINYFIGDNVSKGDHLIEIKAIGGDGKERMHHFNLKVE
jgi:hypothetical protein